jgi:hypothetical protein
MKIYFPNDASGAGVSIRAVIKGLLKRHNGERAQTAHRKKNVPQIMSGWDYRPRKTNRRYAVGRAEAETVEVMSQGPSATNENDNAWFNALECAAHTFIDPDTTAEDPRTKEPLPRESYAVPTYD